MRTAAHLACAALLRSRALRASAANNVPGLVTQNRVMDGCVPRVGDSNGTAPGVRPWCQAGSERPNPEAPCPE